jgi:Skp family chaperone for outer membrane proteins
VRKILAFTVAAVVACIAGPAMCQDAANPASKMDKSAIGLLDIEYIFENHPTIKDAKERLKAEVESTSKKIEERKKDLTTRAESLKQLKAGTPEYKEQEKVLFQMQAETQLEVQNARKDLLVKEVKLIYDNYVMVQDQVKTLAEYWGLDMVMIYDGQQVDANNPQDMQRGMSRQVIYHNPAMDITKPVMEMLNQVASQRGQQQQQAKGGGAAGSRTR